MFSEPSTTSIKYYLLTSLRRTLLDVLRKPRIEMTSDHEVDGAGLLDIPADEEDDGGGVQKDKVAQALNRLSRHQQNYLI